MNALPIYELTYGAAFFTMGLAVVVRASAYATSNFRNRLLALGAFGLLLGIGIWVSSSGAASYGLLPHLRSALYTAGYVALFYFAFGWNGPRARLMHVAALATIVSLVVADLVGYEPAIVKSFRQIGVGMPAAICAAFVFIADRSFQFKSRISTAARWIVATSFVIYAMMLLFPDPTNFFPSSVLNSDSFEAMFGIPTELARGSAILVIMIGTLTLLTSFDITLRRQTENALAISEAKLNRALEVSELGIWEWDIVTDEVSGTTNFFKITGLTPQKIKPTMSDCLEIVHEEDRASVKEAIGWTVKHGTPFKLEHRIVTPAGEMRVVEAHGAFERSSGGSPQKVTGTLMDMTKILAGKLAAETANAAKPNILASVSHEIRTPLNGVLGFLTLLSDTKLDPNQRRLLETAYTSGQNLFALINGVLDIAKIEAGGMENEIVDFSPIALARETVNILAATASKKQLVLDVQCDSDIAFVRSDQMHFRQILSNLVANAVKFTEEGSVTISVSLTGNRLRYDVIDTGIGISGDDQSKLFKKFSQVDPSTRRRFGGTGLGLAISRELVRQLGGEIGVESADGKGARFWFEIPVEKSQTIIENGRTALYKQSVIKLDAKILLADDSETNAHVASAFLHSAGASVDFAVNGMEVLEAVERQTYDLILMDVSMPEMDGIEATQRLRAKPGWTRSIPIVGLTAHALEKIKQKCLSAGMNDFLTKPIDRMTLLDTVSNHLKNRAIPRIVSVRPEHTPDDAPNNDAPNNKAASQFDHEAIRQNFSELPELFAKILATFETEIFERLEIAETALKDGDLAEAGKQGHGLKGMAASVHADQLSKVGRALEKASLAGNIAAAREALTRFRSLAERAKLETPELPFVKRRA